MQTDNKTSFWVLGIFIFLGLSSLGFLLGNALLQYKQLERTVNVKGLSEKEFEADIVIWPIQFLVAHNSLEELYESLDSNSLKIKKFLMQGNIKEEEITFSTPSITDKTANQYSNNEKPEFRYSATQTVTVYSSNIKGVMEVKNTLSKLGKQGIVFLGDNYEASTEYLFTRLNEIKPQMIEEATKEARVVAQKFASDSQSKLGKIKSASQGQFSISQRDKNNPHIKKVRVVSTVEYYLSD
ncbi:MAG: SIMPL domain-containing protein [Bacteroidales bacterium]|nr:SIMPL domain-containing protein [Bacteroidales bacterium]